MVAVKMKDAARNALNIVKGQKVKIKIPVPTTGTPPNTIPLWRLNETDTVTEKAVVIETTKAVSYEIEGELTACESYQPTTGDFVAVKLKSQGKTYSFTGLVD